jgi:hypothetical protein
VRFIAPIARLSCRAQLILRRPAGVLRASRPLLLLTLFYLAIMFIPLASAVAQVELPPPDQSAPLIISAEHGNHWTEGAYQVWVLEGSCRIEQGQSRAAAKEAVLWIDRGGPYGNPPNKVIAYLEGEVNLDHAPATMIGNGAASGSSSTARLQDKTWFGRFYSTSPPELRIVNQGGEPTVKPPVYDNAVARRSPQQLPGSQTASASKSSSQTAKTTQDKAVRKAQFQKVLPDPVAAQNLPTPSTGSSLSAGAAPPTSQGVLPPPGTPPAQILPAGAAPPGMRRIRIVPRSDVPVHAESFPDQASGQTTVVITNGVNILIDGLPSVGGPMGVSGTIDVSADRVVLWTVAGQDVIGGSAVQSPNTPLELYLEGNIVLREQDRVVQAKAMYFNVQQNNGVILDAELLTPTPRFEGLVRLKAEVLRQVDRDRFVAEHASLTTSRMGIPTYEFRSGTLTLTDEQIPVTNPFTGQPQLNSAQEPITEHEQMVTGQNNVIWVEGVPVFYWPFFAADLQRPPLYFDSIEYRHDDVFGSQALVDFNPYQILGIHKPPKGTNWVGSVD